MNRARSLHPSAAPVLLTLAILASACGGEGPPPCSSAAECPAPGVCLVPACVSGQCQTTPAAYGTFVDSGSLGDCSRRICNGAGAAIPQADDADVPVDGNVCTLDLCSGGVASHPPVTAGTACAQDGGSRCDGAGACVQCLAATDCPGSDTECSTRTCSAGVCGVTFAPFGTVLASQTAGDCRQAVCDGVGGTTTTALDSDLPVDGNVCTQDLCSGGTVSHPPVSAGTACGALGSGFVCDGAGACVRCLTASACPGQDGECQHRTCIAGACGIAYASYGTLVASQTAGDCSANVCDGTGDVVVAPASQDVPYDGDPCTLDLCNGTVPSNPPAPKGTACAQSGGKVCDGAGACVACNVGADCGSGVCSSNVCQAPTCTDNVKNGDETDVDCGGTICPKCAPPLACLVDADCTTGICNPTALQCRDPSCTDGRRDGDETDVDCGGSCTQDCGRGKACLANADCATGNCVAGTCAGPLVAGTLPADGAADAPPATAITVLFSKQVNGSSVTVQASSGPCSGSIQVSADDFATCIGLSGKLLAANLSSVALEPAVPLSAGTRYRVRTTTALANTVLGSFEPFETPAGFTVAAGCGGNLVVSQVYPGGGVANASYANDYVELHNNGPVPVTVDGMSVWYTASNYYSWTFTPLAGTVPPGGYYLVQMAGGAYGALLPAPDAVGAASMSLGGGTVALVATPVVPSSSYCPTVGVLDVVGWGSSTSGSTTTPTACREGSAPAPALPPSDFGAALVRVGGGCGDGNGNNFELVSALAVPHSSASAPVLCGCNGTPVNETGLTVEMDFCNVQFPASLTAASGATAGPVYGRVNELTVTRPPGAPAALTSQLGYGPAGTDPRYAAGWTFIPATWDAQFLDDDEFQASFTAPAAGSYAYTYRFSPDGQQWTYCDPDGAGSGTGLVFEPNSLPTLTVTP